MLSLPVKRHVIFMMEVILGYSSAPLRGAESSYQPLWAETCRRARGIPRQWLVLLKMSEELSAGLSCENLWVTLNLGTPGEAAWLEQLGGSWALGQGPRRQQEAGRCSHQAWKRRRCTTRALMAWARAHGCTTQRPEPACASHTTPRLQEQGLAPAETERACTTSNYINQLP